MSPLVAPTGTTAVIFPSLTTVKVAPEPSKLTAVAPVNPEPRMDTLVPGGPLVGAKLPMFGPVTLKFVLL